MQRATRFKAELKMMENNPPPGIICWADDEEFKLQVEMTGPEGSPYEKGIFKLEVLLSDRYPFTPPSISFITPIYHPNIDPKGRICLSALKPKPTGSWTVLLNIPIVLSAIRILLNEPNLGDPLMTDIAKEYSENYKEYRKKAEIETIKNAIKRSKLKSDILENEDDDEEELKTMEKENSQKDDMNNKSHKNTENPNKKIKLTHD